ncbi:MAG TPA: 50S ribosomal protein L25/general stress protein Ctc [Prolixibacteraceae bacterium]|nr:50S ribosomal protein L25/general stress protein Ctc [Prolixibacteraceae bacterium]
MKTFELKGSVREALGKKDSAKLRSEGNVPCVLFGGETPIHFYVVKADLQKLIYTPNVYLVNLEIGKNKQQAIMQDIQFDPVSDEVIHIDFMEITNDKPVKIEVPLEVVGFAKGIRAGGKLQVEVRRLKVMALPKFLPDSIKIDVTELDLGQSLRVSDINLENVTILNGKSVPVVRIMITRAARAAATGDTKK